MKRLCFVVAAACLASGGALAQTIYRCGSEYTRLPCTDGKLVDVSDPVTAERRAEAAAFRPAMAANLGPVPRAVVKPVPVKKKSKTRRKPVDTSVDGDFIARVLKAKAATT
jgi:hypothetical protein